VGFWLGVALLAAPEVSLITMSEGDALYARFGHAALRVRTPGSDRVYNFGTTDFTRPDLIAAFLRGHVRFWVATATWEDTVAAYARDDRSIWQQELRLLPAQHDWLAAKLLWQALPAHRDYAYDHFRDNCTTRVRDLIDEAVGGRVHAALARPYPRRYRELALTGFPRELGLQLGVDLLLGRAADAPITSWDATFLPRILRVALPAVPADDGRALAGPPQPIYLRRAAPLPIERAPMAGRLSLSGLATLFLALAVAGRRSARIARAARIAWGLVGGLVGLALLAIAFYSRMPLLRHNANLGLLVPLDLALIGLPLRLAQPYAWVRVLVCAFAFAWFRPPTYVFALAVCGLLTVLTARSLTPRRR
jgi:hypothetical protein